MASRRGNRGDHGCLAWSSPPTGKKKAKWTTLMIIDSQAVKNTCNASVESKGFCFYKATNGIKRHLAVDPLGFPSKDQKKKEGKTGFVPVKARWVIERTNSWMERCKSLVKNFERTLAHATTKLNLCFVRLMLKRLATG